MSFKSSKIEVAANVATIVVALGICVVLVQRFQNPPTPVPSAIQKGDSLVDLLSVDFKRSPKTLIVAVRSTCVFCDNSMPFYRELVRERDRRSVNVQIVFIAPEDDKDIKAHLTSKDVHPDQLLHIHLPKLRVTGTPTMLVAGSDGRVIDVKSGQLPPDHEQELINVLFGSESKG